MNQGKVGKEHAGETPCSPRPAQEQVDYATREAGRELDLLVTEKVMGFTWPEDRCRVCGWYLVDDESKGCTKDSCSMRPAPSRRADDPPYYSTDISATMWVVERLAEGHMVTLIHCARPNEAKTWIVSLSTNGPGFIGREAEAETLPLAICRAALMACAG